MKRVCLLSLLLVLSLPANAQTAGAQDVSGSEPKRVTLYGLNKHPNDNGRALFSFKTGAFGPDWDLNYGALYVNEEHDWFQVSTAEGVRSAFRDLGAHDWTDSFSVPVVEPFPKLKEGEERVVTVDASGADGADGVEGAPAADADGVVRPRVKPQTARPSRPKHDGVPKVDPIFVKAAVGHIYVIRVVDEDEDFYVLFRVDALARGDNCTISWKRVTPPPAETAGRK
jgi:hypothetical protein